MAEKDSISKLQKSGWKREQIDYAIKKLDGKRTGMYEIPIFSFFEKSKMNEELRKREQSTTQFQQNNNSIKFIKR